MRVDSLLSPGKLTNGVAIRSEVAKAISSIQIAASYAGSNRTDAARTLMNFLTDAAAKVSQYAHAANLTAKVGYMGDSITVGVGASSTPLSWAAMDAVLEGVTANNKGFSGTVLQNRNGSGGTPLANNMLSRYAADLLGANLGDRYRLAMGFNDARYTGAPATMNVTNFEADYRTLLLGMFAQGIPARNITLVTPYWISDTGLTTGTAGFTGQTRAGFEAYVAVVIKLAGEYGCKLADAYAHMRDNGGVALISGDFIHPNDAGHAAIRDCVRNASYVYGGVVSAAPAAPAPAPTPPSPPPPAPSPSPAAAPVTLTDTNAAWRQVETEKYDSSTGTSTFDAKARVVGTVTVGTEAWVELAFSATDAGGVVVLDPNILVDDFTSNTRRAYLMQLINDGRVFQSVNAANSAAMTVPFTFSGFTATSRCRLHLSTGGVVTIQTTTDDGANWTSRMTLGTTLSAGTVMYFKLYNTNARKMYQPRQSGLTV